MLKIAIDYDEKISWNLKVNDDGLDQGDEFVLQVEDLFFLLWMLCSRLVWIFR